MLEAIALTELERVRCLDLAFRVFDMFSDWTAELLAYAKNSLAHRTVPHVIHSARARRAIEPIMQINHTRAANAPHLALVLGSGGVRSVAALGIADVLVNAGLEPDLVVGCSSGALFGACIAMGMTGEQGLAAAHAALVGGTHAAETLERVSSNSWRRGSCGFDAGFSLRDAGLIRARVERAFGDARLEDLADPAARGGDRCRDRRFGGAEPGRVADAVRASMALPFIFPSVEIDGRRLSDGVISDPLPVAAANDADAVITWGFAAPCRAESTGHRGWSRR